MDVSNTTKTILLLAAISATCLVATPLPAYLKDPGSPPDKLLDSLTGDLDRHGIDTRRRWTGLVEPDPTRPQVSRVGGYPTGTKPFITAGWMDSFDVALRSEGHLVAVEVSAGAGGQTMSPSRFVEYWHAADRSQRVFVSFTRSDVEAAEVVKRVLQKRGYVVFTYLEGGAADPQFSGRAVGKMFRTAGHHLVLDTPAARKSIGVALESSSLRLIPPRAATPPTPPTKPSSPRPAPSTGVERVAKTIKDPSFLRLWETAEPQARARIINKLAEGNGLDREKIGQMIWSETGRKASVFDRLVHCYCGAVYVGMWPASACRGPC